MQPQILDGKKAASEILQKLLESNQHRMKTRPPGLAVIQVGEDPASSSYIRGKKQAAEKNGIRFSHIKVPRDTDLQSLKSTIQQLAADPLVDGYILQLPLDVPSHSPLAKAECVHELLALIPPHKDADGLHAENQGRLYAGESGAAKWTCPLPATALGVVRLLQHYSHSLEGKEICVIGKSRLVGMPTAGLCLNAGATVSVCHSKTPDLSKYTKNADIIVVATGRKHLLQDKHLDPNKRSIVIDVGIHADEVSGKLTGDVSPSTYPMLQAYSPVPGGVGPMTVAMLIENTLRLYWKSAG